MENQHDSSVLLRQVQMALQTLCHSSCPPATLPPQGMWPKTRHIADYCGMDIYTTRRYLMKLTESNKAYMSTGPINNSLRWYIADTASLP